jgi:hypothetical protein
VIGRVTLANSIQLLKKLTCRLNITLLFEIGKGKMRDLAD